MKTKNPYKAIALLIGATSVIFLSLWLLCDGALGDFGLNGFTETLGIGITVFVIDFLIRRREEERTLPQRISAHHDVHRLVSKIKQFWINAYSASVPMPPPKLYKDFFTKENLEKIGAHLDMNSEPNITPKRTWWQHLPQEMEEFKSTSFVILERHNNTLDPIAYSLIHTLSTEGMDHRIINGIRQSDKEMGFPRHSNLGSYFFFSEKYFNTVFSLIEWCNKEADLIKEKHGHEIKKLEEKTPNLHGRPMPPKCMISQEELLKQTIAVAKFREASKKI